MWMGKPDPFRARRVIWFAGYSLPILSRNFAEVVATATKYGSMPPYWSKYRGPHRRCSFRPSRYAAIMALPVVAVMMALQWAADFHRFNFK